MTRRILGSTCAAVVLAATMASGQGANQSPTQAPTAGNPLQRPADRATTPSPRTRTDQQVTLTGCVRREGANEFVLADAMPSGQPENLFGGVTGSTSTGVAGTSGTSAASPVPGIGSAGNRYRLSGERDLVDYVGQRVEIVGRMDAATATSGGRPTGSTDLGTPGLGRPASGAGTPGSDANIPGAGTSAAGATSDSTPGPTGSQSTAGRAAAAPPTPHVTITSVRALGGPCK